MRERLTRQMARVARSTDLNRLIKWSKEPVVFPFYHAVSAVQIPHISHLYRVRTTAEFENDLDVLLKWFEPMGMADYLEHGHKGRGKRAMVISFDDGLKECYEVIAPILRKKGIPAVFFLNNRFIDNHGLFHRYKSSLLIHQVREDCRVMEKVSAFLKIPQVHVEKSIRMIGPHQDSLLGSLAREAEISFSEYLKDHPVYMNTEEVRELLKWGFDIGGHSMDHLIFTSLEPDEMTGQVGMSIEDLISRFGVNTRYFSFPFTSDGVPAKVINSLLDKGIATALLGTAGLKRTGRSDYIQRIPMEGSGASALETLQTEYFYYLLKKPLGKNRLRY
jgi:peptidoglycan/xylan/chitin deacetylase (PgdA/CDA1 family)